jgi:hypothetical protein
LMALLKKMKQSMVLILGLVYFQLSVLKSILFTVLYCQNKLTPSVIKFVNFKKI